MLQKRDILKESDGLPLTSPYINSCTFALNYHNYFLLNADAAFSHTQTIKPAAKKTFLVISIE